MTPGVVEPHARGAGRVSEDESFALTKTKQSLPSQLRAALRERAQSNLYRGGTCNSMERTAR